MKMLKKISRKKFMKTDMREIYFMKKDEKNLQILSMVEDVHKHEILSFSQKIYFDLKKDIHLDQADLSYNIADDLMRKYNEFDGEIYTTEVEPDIKAEFYSECKAANKRRVPIYVLDCKELHIGRCDFFDKVKSPFILLIDRNINC